jgi:hypothetical protein
MHTSMASVARSSLTLLAMFLLVLGLHGQETCTEEVKLLLSPTQVQAAILAFHPHKDTHGRVYFYDTPALDLLSKGVILRVRQGAEIDVTAKLRPISGEKFVDPSGGRERFKCEVDLNDGVENPSFSFQNKYRAAMAPETGEELFQLLSEGHKRLLEEAKVPIDWKRVKRIAEIQSTSWIIRWKEAGCITELDYTEQTSWLPSSITGTIWSRTRAPRPPSKAKNTPTHPR